MSTELIQASTMQPAVPLRVPPVPWRDPQTVSPAELREYIQDLERSYLLAALERCGGVRTHAADLLKMSYRSFRHYAKKYGV